MTFKPLEGVGRYRLPFGLLYAGWRSRSWHWKKRMIMSSLFILYCSIHIVASFSTKRRVFLSSSAGTDSMTRSGRTGHNVPHSGEWLSTEAVENLQHTTFSASSERSDIRILDKQHADVDSAVEPGSIKEVIAFPSQETTGELPSNEKKRAKHKITEGDYETKPASSARTLRTVSLSRLTSQAQASVRVGREQRIERLRLEQALKRMTDLLPDEVHMRELLRPVEGSGKEKMREMGLRTRAYKKYLDAWEALHVTTDEKGSAYARSDLMGYLRDQYFRADQISSDIYLSEWTLASTVHAYESYRIFLHSFATLLFPWFMPYFGDHMTLHMSFEKGGRGIVLTAGDDQASYLLTTIWSYRQLGCTLPIEVLYLGEQDLSEEYRMDLERLPGVVTRDLAQMTNDEGWSLVGWAAKPFAILLSSFQEVIFIDADALFFQNPEILFDDPDYRRTGALFFKDRLMMPEAKKRWLQEVLPNPISRAAKTSRWWTGESAHMQESGVVVVDKSQHFTLLMLVTRFNGPDRNGDEGKGTIGVYDMMYGDKETFWIAFLLAGDDNFAFHAGDAGVMGDLQSRDENAAPAILQHNDAVSSPIEGTIVPTRAMPSSSAVVETTSIPSRGVAFAERERAPSYTICNPQLLHLDGHNRPLWFNGWLYENKFAPSSQRRFAQFKYYLQESKDASAWQLGSNNWCCLTVDEARKFTFTEAEYDFLDLAIARARDVGVDYH